ncbi:MAG: DUF924 family protein [Pseudomonadota bacterium]
MAHALLEFWFGSLDGEVSAAQRAKWFASDAAFDVACARFEDALTAVDAEQSPLPDTPLDALERIILTDQIPRNIYRGSARAFAWDTHALGCARHAIEHGWDLQLSGDQRAFMYMPFEHSEVLIDQHTAVGLFAKLRDDASGGARSVAGNNLRFAQQHRDIILRFGRFPHRNAVLGRTSSDQEREFVATGDGFGQSPN